MILLEMNKQTYIHIHKEIEICKQAFPLINNEYTFDNTTSKYCEIEESCILALGRIVE